MASSGVSQKGAATIAGFRSPYKGVLRDIPFSEIPDQGLFQTLNCLYRAGALVARPGMVLFSSTDFTNRVTGTGATLRLASIAFQANAFQNNAFQLGAIASSNTSATYVIGTNTKLWSLDSGAWHDRTGTPFSGNLSAPVRFTNISIGGINYILATNSINPPQQWDGAANTFVAVSGPVPLFTDWTVSSQRVIGILPPYTVQWGSALDITGWVANQYVLCDTPDPLICVRNLGTLNVAIYKTNSIWMAIAQGGPDAQYFRFELRGTFEGPCSPNAVVDVDGTHYYMTNSGRVGVFDGTSFQWINDPILPVIRPSLDTSSMALAHGSYDMQNREVWFTYPTVADMGTGNCTGLLVISLPRAYSYEGLTFHTSWLGQWAYSVTASMGRILGSEHDVMVFGQPATGQNKSFTLALNQQDNDMPWNGFWQTGMQLSPKGEVFRATGVETYSTRGQSFGSLTQKVLYSDQLGEDGGTLGPGVSVDLTIEPVHGNVVGSGTGPGAQVARGRFFGLRYDFTAPMQGRYAGGRVLSTSGPE